MSHLLGKKHKNAEKNFNEEENHEAAEQQAKEKFIEEHEERKKILASK